LKSVFKKVVALGYLSAIAGAFMFLLHLFISNWWICASITALLSPFIIALFVLYKYTRMKEPLRYISKRIFLGIYNVLIYRRRFVWEQLYDILCWCIPSTEWKHMNWGYASMEADGAFLKDLSAEDETERFSIQLYHLMATGMGTFKNLDGKTLVEVSSGRGGGLDYISRCLNPDKCIGVDISQVQIDYCKKIYEKNPKLFFVNGESEKLSKLQELGKEEIDIIINVESGHCYSNFQKFIKEVDRVLKPGGIFAYSDFRPTHEWAKTEEELTNFSMKILKKENISENVMHSLKLDEARKWELIENKLGPVLRFFFKQIGGVKGSHIFEGLSKGTMISTAYVLKKPE
jgi:SAM-dependent methyltransferase